MTLSNNRKIINKFIPKTDSHSKLRISKIVQHIQLEAKKNKEQRKYKKRTGIKTFKKKYLERILQNAEAIEQPLQQPPQPTQPLQQPPQPPQQPTQPPQQPTQQPPPQPPQPPQQHIQQPPQQHTQQPPQQPPQQTTLPIEQIQNTPYYHTSIKHIKIPDMHIKKEKKQKTHKSNKYNKYIIAIPSYNRPELIQVKTLALLHKHNINSKLIHIFVSDREQYDLYKSKIPKNLYNKLIIGVKGLKNQRNYINNYYPEGYHIVEMDDDIDKIVQLVVRKITKKTIKKSQYKIYKTLDKIHKTVNKTTKPIENLDQFIKDAFKRCVSNGIFLWGVYPLANPYFMTETITNDLRFIVGPFWGMINRHREDLQLTIDEKENSERTLQNWVIDGTVLRFNNIGIETKYYKNKGGMQNNNKDRNYRQKEALKSAHYLHNKYPSLTKIHLSKKSGVPEIKLLRK